MTKKELETLVRQLTEQNAVLTRMLTAMQMELQSRKRNDIDVMPKIHPQPYEPTITAPLPRWWEQAMCGTSLVN